MHKGAYNFVYESGIHELRSGDSMTFVKFSFIFLLAFFALYYSTWYLHCVHINLSG